VTQVAGTLAVEAVVSDPNSAITAEVLQIPVSVDPQNPMLNRVEAAFTDQTSVVVVHNFGRIPHVTVLDGAGEVIIADSIRHDSLKNHFTVTFTLTQSGTIISSL